MYIFLFCVRLLFFLPAIHLPGAFKSQKLLLGEGPILLNFNLMEGTHFPVNAKSHVEKGHHCYRSRPFSQAHAGSDSRAQPSSLKISSPAGSEETWEASI